MPKYYTSPNFFSGVDHANLVFPFRGSKYLPEIRFSNVYLFVYEYLKRFI